MVCRKQIKYILIWIISSVSCQTAWGAAIRGHIQTDTSWRQVIYLSLLPNFDAMTTASYEFLIGQASIDSLGNFEFEIEGLPDGEYLYRLHVCKKQDPISTIILGGRDENFVHFIMRPESRLEFIQSNGNALFQNISVEGEQANYTLHQLIRMSRKRHSGGGLSSDQAKVIARKRLINSYQQYADTSSSQLVRLFAFELLNRIAEPESVSDLYKSLVLELEATTDSTPYQLQFFRDYAFLDQRNGLASINWLWLILPLGLGALLFLRNRKKHIEPSDPRPEEKKLLSRREQIVYELLKKGKTNKEIAQELHIEVSTVKSHVNKIYSKLGFKNRTQIFQSAQSIE